MLSKSLIQFSVDGQGYVPSLLFDLRPNYSGGNEDNGDLLRKVPCRHCCTQCRQPCSRAPLPETLGHSQASMGQSLLGSLLLSSGSRCAQGFVCVLQESVSPVLCKFWQLYGGTNGDLLQEGLCHTQVCCTQPYPGLLQLEPLPLWQSTADPYLHRIHSNTVLSVSVVSLGPGVHKVCLIPLSIASRNGV